MSKIKGSGSGSIKGRLMCHCLFSQHLTGTATWLHLFSFHNYHVQQTLQILICRLESSLKDREFHFTDASFLSSCTTIIKVTECDMIWGDQVVKCLNSLWQINNPENDWRDEMRTFVEWKMRGTFLSPISHPTPLQAATMVYKSFCIDCAAASTGSFFFSCFLSRLIRLLSGECLLSRNIRTS